MRSARPARSLWRELRRRLPRVGCVAVMSDFDGTLAPIVSYAPAARLRPATRQALRWLARCPRARVGIVSGRRLGELRRLVGLETVWYVGSHGLEVCPPHGRPRILASSAERRRMRVLQDRLKRRLRGLTGIWVERKPASTSVHYRRARPAVVRRARRVVEQERRRAGEAVRFLQGKKIWEFLPPGEASKASGARYLLARWRHPHPRPVLAFFLGDDEADEQVFRRLRRSLLSIAVGRTRTQADYRLADPAAVGRFLAGLAEVLRCA